MGVSVTVLYPYDHESTFNLEYYLTAHMPLVQKKFEPHGMTAWRVNKLETTASGETSPYSIKCTMDFDSEQQVHNAFQAEAETVMGDIKNFSNKEPIVMIGLEAQRVAEKPAEKSLLGLKERQALPRVGNVKKLTKIEKNLSMRD